MDRDGVVTTYTYSDNGSPSVPNITVQHDDGAKSFYYLNDAGELVRIAHTKVSGSSIIVVADFEVLERDDNRRITLVEENFLDSGASDGYRTEQVAFSYGDGNLTSGELDTGSEAEPTQFYWSFAPSSVLASSDPNRLVREHRTLIDTGYTGGEAVTFDKRYYYDPNGNRLAVVEVDPDDEEVFRSVTRYNYMYPTLGDGSDEDDPPGTPDPESTAWMNYAGTGRDQLLSTQKFIFEGDANNTLDRVQAETFGYADGHAHMKARHRVTWMWGESAWWVQLVEDTDYTYPYDSLGIPLSRLESVIYEYSSYTEQQQQTPEHMGAIGEMYAYDDLIGRRTATFRCQVDGSHDIPWGPGMNCESEGTCKARTMMYDYYGLSQRVAAVRMSPFWFEDCPCNSGGRYKNDGDEFLESYTYGPVGVTTRTDEQQDADPQTGWDHYVMADVFGGTTGLWAQSGSGPRDAAFQHFDAFGVRVGVDATWSADYDASRYRWRSQEGSETDDLAINDSNGLGLQPPTLVYMQTRHYDPGLGRFIMADSIPIGAFSPQGLNRYAYCTNDPVNGSDASGTFISLFGYLSAFGMLATIVGAFAAGGVAGPGALYGALIGIGIELGTQLMSSKCTLYPWDLNWNSIFKAGFGGAVFGGLVGPAVAGGYARARAATLAKNGLKYLMRAIGFGVALEGIEEALNWLF